jgi:hypothetical protein
MANGRSKNFDPAVIAAAAANQAGIYPGPGEDWFGPGPPLPPAAPPAVKGRQFDYAAGANLAYIPRGDQPISFAELRALAQNCDLVRLVIETRKDQVCKLRWSVKPSEEAIKAGGAVLTAAEGQAKAAKALLKRPDKVHSFNQWLRMLLEDMMVIDAATAYPRPTRGGGLFSLDVLDGATIRPVVDQGGRTPLEGPAYQQVIKGVPAANFTLDELIYFPRNPLSWRVYGFSPVEQIILVVNIILRRQMHLLQYYTEGNLPDALLEVPEGWSTEQIREWQQYWDSLLAGNTAQRRRGTWVPKGMTPHFMKEAALKDPIDEWFARVVCYCFSVSPQPFVQIINRATAETAQEAALQEGLAPVMEWAVDFINRSLNGNGYDLVEFGWEEESSIDPNVQSEIDDRDVRNGIRLRSQIRTERGLEDDGVPDFIITNMGPVLVADIGIPAEEPLAAPEKKSIGKPGTPAPGEGEAAKALPAQKLAKTAKGKKKVKIKPIDRERPAIKKARTALKKLMQKAFKVDAKAAAEQLAQDLKLAKAADQGDQDLIDKVLKKLKTEGIDAIREEVQKILAQVAQSGIEAAFVQIDFDSRDIVSQVNKLAVEWAENRAAELVTKIEESTRDYLRADVTQAMEEGWSSKQLSKALEENYGFSESRSDMIARTEIGQADVEGNMMAYRASGVVEGKEWIKGSEHAGDDECDDNAADGVIPLDQAFSSGDQNPLAHPNCVCDILPVLLEQGEAA